MKHTIRLGTYTFLILGLSGLILIDITHPERSTHIVFALPHALANEDDEHEEQKHNKDKERKSGSKHEEEEDEDHEEKKSERHEHDEHKEEEQEERHVTPRVAPSPTATPTPVIAPTNTNTSTPQTTCTTVYDTISSPSGYTSSQVPRQVCTTNTSPATPAVVIPLVPVTPPHTTPAVVAPVEAPKQPVQNITTTTPVPQTTCTTVYDTVSSPSGYTSSQVPREVCTTNTSGATPSTSTPAHTTTVSNIHRALPVPAEPSTYTAASTTTQDTPTATTLEIQSAPQTPGVLLADTTQSLGTIVTESTNTTQLTSEQIALLTSATQNAFLQALWDIKQILMGLLSFTTLPPQNTPIVQVQNATLKDPTLITERKVNITRIPVNVTQKPKKPTPPKVIAPIVKKADTITRVS